MAKLKNPVLTIDGIILKNGEILLVKRAIYPFSGYWVLPGGHVNYGERVEQALKREMKEELGLTVKIKKLIGVYSDPKRDPRYHTVSIVYFCQKTKGKIRLSQEASEFKYFSLKKGPGHGRVVGGLESQKIGFDHRKIINDLTATQKLLHNLTATQKLLHNF